MPCRYVKSATEQLDRILLHGTGGTRCLNGRRYFERGARGLLPRMLRTSSAAVIVAANEPALMYSLLDLRRFRKMKW